MGRRYVSEAERKRNKENVCWNGFTSVKMKPKPPLKIHQKLGSTCLRENSV